MTGITRRGLAVEAAMRQAVEDESVFDSLTGQWTFALTQSPTPWVLALDADYFVPR